MQYRQAGATGESISLQGLGCMRFKKRGPVIDRDAADRVMSEAIERGINYFDTAYAYAGNEECVGRFLSHGHRDQVLLATKLPHYQCTSVADFDRIFDEELSRLKTDHIDFYLMHMLTSATSWQRIVEMGIEDWIEARRASGQIAHIGFSFHGGAADFQQVVDAYPWEFCQIQLNYLDAHAQAGLEGLRYAANTGLPVIIMEPLRGGRLADKLPRGAQAVIDGAEPHRDAAAWGLRWLYDLPEVTCVLSGMNEVEQVQENCALADEASPGMLTDAERAVYDRIVREIEKTEKVGCTGCGYCMPCPHGVDIPTCFRCYNTAASEGWANGFSSYIMNTSLKAQPSNAGLCVKCGRCEKKCPQQIPIREKLDEVKKSLEGVPYRLVSRFKGVKYKV